ncbi:enoyl-CoA hydratase/isomerase family protein [Natrialba asiatica]|uniref:Enoyl-CoA hydratase/isomerase n=1 Tax=Natrialba asiatica (strain ATCC 700177 / DSM 12278 / JCM 9576 / FERM P-10747 / NBRC 102637 / 172P1) TaxID=29540 RepID=M0AFL3_NATA1|nr:enoyl-CoA hydratase-related protein [Natrialba asiatica]ELY97191.1 enoyl-CoA hydratase/isomerase [Natrialba asiatica DSM 12278]
MQYDTIESELEDGIATVTLDRPESLNAFSPTLRGELVDCLEEIRSLDRDESEPNVRAVVVEGAGKQAFSVGADVNADGDAPQPNVKEFRDELVLPPNLPMPVVAEIDGYCLGAGLEFAMACDFRLATPESELGFPESRLGILPANGGVQRLVSQVGSSRAKELVMAGERVSAERAESDGFVDYVHPRAEIDSFVREFVDRITTGAPLAIRAAKDVIDTGLSTDLETAIRYEHRASRALRETRDHEEGQRAFREDREPEWQWE